MRARSKIGLIVAGVIIGAALLRIAGAFQPLEAAVRRVALPAVRVLALAGSTIRGALLGSPDLAALRERNKELEARVAAISVDYVRLRALEEENRALQALTKFVNDSGYDYVPSRIIARSVDPLNATVVIDRGSKDGVETGMAVVVGQGIFVGKVTQLKERVATVTLVSDERSRVAAALAGKDRLFGLVEGRGNNAARLTLVPQAEALQRDDLVVTAGTEDKIPANLTIGLVNEIEGKPTDPFKNASIEPLARADRLDVVLVLRPVALRPEGGGT